jgi:hypothetical protein
MKAAKKFLSKKMVYRNLAYTGLLAFSLYICYKTYDTQRKIREGMSPEEAKQALNEAVKEAVEECQNDNCPTSKDACDSADDEKECKKNIKICKEKCSVGGKGKKKK